MSSHQERQKGQDFWKYFADVRRTYIDCLVVVQVN